MSGNRLACQDLAATQNQSHIMDLNVDCQLMILERLNVPSLISIAETNKYFAKLVPSVLQRIFAKKLVIFHIPYYSDKIDLNVFETDDDIQIQNIRTISKLLQKYGHLISRLKIEQFYSTGNGAYFIQNLTNLYCSEALIELHMVFVHFTSHVASSSRYSAKHSVEEFKKPFKRLERLFLHGDFKDLNNQELDFNEIFPALRYLSLELIGVQNISWVDQNFSHLKELHAQIWSTHEIAGFFSESAVEKLISTNPQIQRLTLRNSSGKLLKFIASELPAVEHLGLELCADPAQNILDRKIHFENVKSFKMYANIHNLLRNIVFEQLDEFQLEDYQGDPTIWIEFIDKNSNLSKLRVPEQYINNTDVLQLSMANLGLTEVSIALGEDVTNGAIVKFIKKHKNLMKMDLIKCFDTNSRPNKGQFRDMMNVLNSRFGNKWNFKESLTKIQMEHKGYNSIMSIM